jgi:hypothetical protein
MSRANGVHPRFFTRISPGFLCGFVDFSDSKNMCPEDRGEWRWIIRPVQVPGGYVCLRWRIASYLLPWLGTLAAFFILFPRWPEEVPLVEFVMSAPVGVALGLAQVLCGGDFPSQATGWMVVLGLAVHAGLILACARLEPLVALFALEVLFFGVGTAGVFHLSHLPTGG